MVATSTMSRGARASLRITTSSVTAPVAAAAASDSANAIQ